LNTVRNILTHFFPALLIFMMAGCGTTRQMSNRNLSHLYKTKVDRLHPEYRVYHASDSFTLVYFRLYSPELLYSRPATNADFQARYSISYDLRPNYESKVITDSNTFVFTDNNKEEHWITGSIRIKTRPGLNYVAEISFFDMNHMSESVTFLELNRENKNTAQNFLPLSGASGLNVQFSQAVRPGDITRIGTPGNPKEIFVRYYARDFSLPPPPFSYYNPKGFDFKPDSIFVLSNPNDSFLFVPGKKGLYHIQTDTSKIEGFTLTCFDENFDGFRSYEGMLYPLRYITSRSEHEKMMAFRNKKAAVDSFWIHTAGSADRARELIRKFYNRTLDANRYFTSYLEGWRFTVKSTTAIPSTLPLPRSLTHFQPTIFAWNARPFIRTPGIGPPTAGGREEYFLTINYGRRRFNFWHSFGA
jgi:hypothetical protein